MTKNVMYSVILGYMAGWGFRYLAILFDPQFTPVIMLLFPFGVFLFYFTFILNTNKDKEKNKNE